LGEGTGSHDVFTGGRAKEPIKREDIEGAIKKKGKKTKGLVCPARDDFLKG